MNGERILIAEDSTTQAMHLQYVLESNGHEVRVTTNGIDALAAIETEKPSIVISDVVMPGMDGYELCRRIKADPENRDIAVVLLTSLTQPEAVIWALQCGADKFFTKPLDTGHLASMIESLNLNRRLKVDEPPPTPTTLSYHGETYSIASSRGQILTLLLSTYETAMAKNEELMTAQEELRDLNSDLEATVRRRTAALTVEVAEHQKTEDTLRQERLRLDRIMETSPAGIFMADRQGRFVFANRRAQEMLGRSIEPDDAVRLDDPVWQITDFEGRPVPPEDLVVARVLAAREPVSGVHQALVTAGGERIHLSFNGAPLFDDTGDVAGVVLAVDDVSEQFRSDEVLRTTMEQLRQSVTATIRAMARVVEAKDPYTGGHQERVATLAAAIAIECGLDEARVDGIRMTGIIHDIGKIVVPSELLVKPTRLTPMEFTLIKAHAEAGYDILKDIDFPWPVARMVREHHERLDGSGYPLGVHGDDLLLESRIIAVADVVESMAAHRPYRAALGIDVALDEIRQNAGVLYEPAVVEACCRLFEEKGFSFE